MKSGNFFSQQYVRVCETNLYYFFLSWPNYFKESRPNCHIILLKSSVFSIHRINMSLRRGGGGQFQPMCCNPEHTEWTGKEAKDAKPEQFCPKQIQHAFKQHHNVKLGRRFCKDCIDLAPSKFGLKLTQVITIFFETFTTTCK